MVVFKPTVTFSIKINQSCKLKFYCAWMGKISQIEKNLHLLVVQLGLRSDLTRYHDHVVLSNSWVMLIWLTSINNKVITGVPNVENENISCWISILALKNASLFNSGALHKVIKKFNELMKQSLIVIKMKLTNPNQKPLPTLECVTHDLTGVFKMEMVDPYFFLGVDFLIRHMNKQLELWNTQKNDSWRWSAYYQVICILSAHHFFPPKKNPPRLRQHSLVTVSQATLDFGSTLLRQLVRENTGYPPWNRQWMPLKLGRNL